MTATILAVLFFTQGASAQTNANKAEINSQIREVTGSINFMLGALMAGAEKDGKAELIKKLEILKSVRKEMGEETLLRLQLAEEIQRLQMSVHYQGYNNSMENPAADPAARLNALNKIEKALEGSADQKQLKLMKEKSESGRVKGALSSLRSAIQVYYGDTEGTFPSDLSALTERAKYISEIPSITPPGHKKGSNAVKLVSGVKNMAELLKKVDDAGGWLYVNDDASPQMWGTIIVNCSHQDVGASKAYMYNY